MNIYLVFLILAIEGIIIFKILFPTKNKLLLLGGGMIIGALQLLLILSIISYAFKGEMAIQIIFYCSFLAYLFLYLIFFKRIKTSTNFFDLRLTPNFLLNTLVLSLYIILIYLYIQTLGVGSDVYIYSGIASSFARGNYPSVLPWQPDFLLIYHFGMFALEGALSVISSNPYAVIHYNFTFYVIAALFIFLVGIARNKINSLISFMPAIFGLVLFGGPLLLIKGWLDFLKNLFSFSFSKIITNLSYLPQFKNFYSGQGAGPSNLSDLFYINFTALGLASFLLFIYFASKPNLYLKSWWHYLLLITIAVLTLSIDETFFLIEIPILLIIPLWEWKKYKVLEILKAATISSLLFVLLIFLIQNPIRDSLLTQSPEDARFTIFYPFFLKNTDKKNVNLKTSLSFDEKFKMASTEVGNRWKSYIIKGASDGKWLVLPLIINLFLLVYSLLSKSKFYSYLCIANCSSIIIGLLITNTFWISNFVRFFTQSYQLMMIILAFLIIDLNYKKVRSLSLLAFVLFILMLPQFITSHASFIKPIFSNKKVNFIDNNPIDETYKNINRLLPFGNRIIFIEDFPHTNSAYIFNLRAVTQFGMSVPISPYQKVLTPDDIGLDFYDIEHNISPQSIKNLRVDYIFVMRTGWTHLSQNRINQLKDSRYFKPLYFDNFGVLYKINDDYKNLIDQEPTLTKLLRMIPDGKTVFIDQFYTNYIPKILILDLSKRTNLYGFPHAVGGGNFTYIESYLPFSQVCTIKCIGDPGYPSIKEIPGLDFIIADPTTDPQTLYSGNFIKIAEIPHIALFKNLPK